MYKLILPNYKSIPVSACLLDTYELEQVIWQYQNVVLNTHD